MGCENIEFDQGWGEMEKGIEKLKRILAGEKETPFTSREYMTLYTTIYNMCNQKAPHDYSEQLYDKYKETLDEYITSIVYEDVHPTIKDIVLSLIDKEREGEQIDRALLKNALDIFVEMGGGQMNRYQDDFEAPFLQETSNYFSRKASKWIEEASCPDYLLKSEECLKKEVDKVSNYLHSSTETKLMEKVQHELLVVYVNQLLEKEDSGIKVLFRDDKVDDLSRTYRVYNKISQGLDLVANVFKQHVTIEGTAFVQQAEEAASNQVLVKNILELHDNYMTYLNSCFQNHNLFHKALKEAFEVFCNKNVYGSPSAEILASFADHILRKGGSEKLSDKVIEETLEKVVKLLQYVIDKDVFAEFYRKKLARRLLFDRGTNDDQERSILSKLKQQFGAPLTSKMEGMLVLCLPNRSQICTSWLDFTVTVLTTGFWPSYKSFDLSLPPEMVKCVEVFKGFYGTKTKHRKLTWIYSLGTSHINGKFEPKPIELIVSTHQAAVLLLFNASERLSYSEIVAQLNLAHDDLIRLLHSLSCAKYKILNKEPSSRSISQSDSFKFNPNFTDKMRRIKVPLPPVDERKKVIEDVDKDRPYAIDAAIVRIMKSRKVMTHQQLISETIEQLSRMFKPNIKSIKKRIEDLITRDYMERDRDNSHMFRYLA
ncbi:hypothetical protein V6Z11_A08G137900 [Gossypium hirsutum]